MTMTPSGVPSRSNGVASMVRMGAGLPELDTVRELGLGRPDVLDVDRPPVEHCPSAHESRLTGTVSPTASICVAIHAAPPAQMLPSRRKIDESVAPHTRAAFSATASMTGWRSVGELADDPQDLAVAVCCSRASVSSRFRASSSLKSRTFSMAITAWSAKVSSSAICCVRKRA